MRIALMALTIVLAASFQVEAREPDSVHGYLRENPNPTRQCPLIMKELNREFCAKINDKRSRVKDVVNAVSNKLLWIRGGWVKLNATDEIYIIDTIADGEYVDVLHPQTIIYSKTLVVK